MDLVRICSKHLGGMIATINEEDLMEEILQSLSKVPVKRLIKWLADGFDALPDDTTVEDMLVDEEKYDAILDEAFNPEALFTEEQLAELMAKFGGEEVEPD